MRQRLPIEAVVAAAIPLGAAVALLLLFPGTNLAAILSALALGRGVVGALLVRRALASGFGDYSIHAVSGSSRVWDQGARLWGFQFVARALKALGRALDLANPAETACNRLVEKRLF